MTTTTGTIDGRSAGASWAPSVFKTAAAVTFALGVVMHTTRLLIGVENMVRYVMTPPVDIAFAVVVLIAAIPGWLSWRRYSGGRAGRLAYGFMMFMLIISLPIHFRTLLTWSTEYLMAFPTWYSAIEVPMFFALSVTAARLKFD